MSGSFTHLSEHCDIWLLLLCYIHLYNGVICVGKKHLLSVKKVSEEHMAGWVMSLGKGVRLTQFAWQAEAGLPLRMTMWNSLGKESFPSVTSACLLFKLCCGVSKWVMSISQFLFSSNAAQSFLRPINGRTLTQRSVESEPIILS